MIDQGLSHPLKPSQLVRNPGHYSYDFEREGSLKEVGGFTLQLSCASFMTIFHRRIAKGWYAFVNTCIKRFAVHVAKPLVITEPSSRGHTGSVPDHVRLRNRSVRVRRVL